MIETKPSGSLALTICVFFEGAITHPVSLELVQRGVLMVQNDRAVEMRALKLLRAPYIKHQHRRRHAQQVSDAHTWRKLLKSNK